MSNEVIKRVIPGTVEIRKDAEGNETRTIEGYGVVFNKWSSDLGWFKEKIERTAFDDVDMSAVIATFNHNFDYVMARSDSNTLKLSVDDYGVKYEFQAPNTTAGNDLLENVRIGNVKGSSFMFTIDRGGATWNWTEGDEGLDERTITKIGRFIEVGPVTNPAYPDTTASAKRDYESAKAEYQKEKQTEQKEAMRSVVDTERKYKQLRAKI